VSSFSFLGFLGWLGWLRGQTERGQKGVEGGDPCGNSREVEGEIPAVITGSLKVRFLR
jgi:hypothetical protein